MDVPSEPKVYTTVYDNFKGVDFTNDPSNVFRRRSPSGKNMLPDIDGRPYKRKGWEIAIPSSVMRTAAGADIGTNIIPDKTHYFELGGNDHIMVFNNLGVFDYRKTGSGSILTHISSYTDTDGNTQSFPPQIDGNNVPVDSRRAFFFEGGGTAGFYFFVGIKLFRYDGEHLYEQTPKVPRVLIGCDPNGAGTMNEGVNLLTRKRTAEYWCDGTTQTFTVLEGIKTGTTPVVHTRDNTGAWVINSGWTLAGNSITFSSPPAVVVSGEGNMRITYEPPGDDITLDTRTGYLFEKDIQHITTITQRRIKSGEDGEAGAWKTAGTSIKHESVLYSVPNIMLDANKDKDISFEAYSNESWSAAIADAFVMNWCAYDDIVDIRMVDNPEAYNVTPYAEKTIAEDPTDWKKVPKSDTYYQERKITQIRTYRVKGEYTQYYYTGTGARTAFTQCAKAVTFGNGIYNQVFLSASQNKDYNCRLWYSAAADPTYYPDLNYVEVGATDKPVMGMLKIGQYLGVIKKSESIETACYMVYPTSFSDTTTYAVKQSISGIGSISKGAFNILNDEPLFLSKNGIMGVDMSDNENHIKNRSFFINKKLVGEKNLEKAISFVHDTLYYLAINGHCYVLDGSQRNSWANTKTNLQYECYYLENIPAQCFARMNDELWFSDFQGNICRFKSSIDDYPYHDDYSVSNPNWYAAEPPVDDKYLATGLDGDGSENAYLVDNNEAYISGEYPIDEDTTEEGVYVILHGIAKKGDTIRYRDYVSSDIGFLETSDDEILTDDIDNYLEALTGVARYHDTWYTIIAEDGDYVVIGKGVPVDAEWSTIADDDGMVHFFKSLRKKGNVISLLPSSDSGVRIYIKADSKEPVFVGETDVKDYDLPYDVFAKKKIKKYKRLQFIFRNDALNDSFGIDQIVKSYTVGNYSKNRK